MNNKVDRRTVRTRSALINAFVWLVHHGQRIESIRIHDIIERANVGRSTFYEHFRNKDEILTASFQPLFSLLSGMIDPKWDRAFVVEQMEFNWAHRDIGRSLFGSSRRVLVRVLARAIAERLRKIKFAADRRIPVSVVSVALAEAQMGALQAWVYGELTCTPAELADTLIHFARSCVANRFDKNS